MFNNLQLVSWGKPIGQGVTGAQYVTAEGVAKVWDATNAPYVVANEYVAAEIARFIGLPVPPSYALKDMQQRPAFVSMNFNPRKLALPPAIPPIVARSFPIESAGVVIFDALIGNSDRHNRNLAHDLVTRSLAVFDHSHSLLGYLPNLGVQRLAGLQQLLGITGVQEPAGHMGNRHCLLDALTDYQAVDLWLRRIEQIPDYFLERLSADSIMLGVQPAEAQALSRFLIARKVALRQLVRAQQNEFRNIVQWGII